ncbi:MAG: hypothetical protein AAF191_10675 [Verrucomicrobiota bacterium]
MRKRRRLVGGGLIPLFLGVAVSLGQEQEAFDLFPIEKPWENVRIPRYSDSDALSQVMHSETLTREVGEQLRMDGLTVVTFDARGGLSLRLKTKRGIYDITTEMLRTHTRTYIEHPQFDMKGDRARFSAKTQEGILEGNVEMLIYNVPVAMPLPGKPAQVLPNRKGEDGGPKKKPQKTNPATELAFHQDAPRIQSNLLQK